MAASRRSTRNDPTRLLVPWLADLGLQAYVRRNIPLVCPASFLGADLHSCLRLKPSCARLAYADLLPVYFLLQTLDGTRACLFVSRPNFTPPSMCLFFTIPHPRPFLNAFTLLAVMRTSTSSPLFCSLFGLVLFCLLPFISSVMSFSLSYPVPISVNLSRCFEWSPLFFTFSMSSLPRWSEIRIDVHALYVYI